MNKKNLLLLLMVLGFVSIAFLWLVFFGKVEKPSPVVQEVIKTPKMVVEKIGSSAEGRIVEVYSFGSSTKNILFVGGIHGGYEWNTVRLAYQMLDFLKTDTDVVPGNLSVNIIPVLNPDGLYRVTGSGERFDVKNISTTTKVLESGRFNGNFVDLNRNFDCKWQPKSTWKNKTVSAGSKVFSEPESVVLRDYILKTKPLAVVFWHSQSGSVYASRCEKGTLPETIKIMNAYAEAADYKAVETFDAYQTTGDAEAWLAKIGIPSITVELTTHRDVEFEKNLAGVKSLIEYYK